MVIRRPVSSSRQCPMVLTACDSVVHPCLCQRATENGNPRIGKNRRRESRRPHRVAPRGSDGSADNEFGRKPCCTTSRLTVAACETRLANPVGGAGGYPSYPGRAEPSLGANDARGVPKHEVARTMHNFRYAMAICQSACFELEQLPRPTDACVPFLASADSVLWP
jgi:hypothetical protein